MRSASNGMPCCFDIPEARRDPSLGFCDLCSERLRVKVETDAELSRLRAEVERLREENNRFREALEDYAVQGGARARKALERGK